ncbi:MAG: hypothetical protein K6B65_03020 [Bacilli bacterium]|nr:hypothetical protein [Bacilli bacterium]
MNQANMDLAITLFEQITHSKVYSIRPIQADLCNENYLINLQFVIRLKHSYAIDRDFFSAKEEYQILRDLSASPLHDILPQIMGYDPQSGNMLRKYVILTEEIQEKNGEFLRYLSLIETIKKLHSFQGEYRFVNPILLYNEFKDRLGEEFHKEYENDVLSRCKQAFSSSPIRPCACHIDPYSFIYDQKRKNTKLTSLEYGGSSFEIVDIASILCENEISPSMKERLINAYYGIKNVTQSKIDDVYAVMELLDMIGYLHATLRYKEDMEETQLSLAHKKMGSIRKHIRLFLGKPK